jgi:hypothetical protein
VLDDASKLAIGLRSGTRELPSASRRLAVALESGATTLRDEHTLADLVSAGFQRLSRLLDTTHAVPSLRLLTDGVRALGGGLQKMVPGQVQCNVGGLWTRNVPGVLTDGDADGAWFTAQLVINAGQMLQNASPSPDLHVNPWPNENAGECEAGNERYDPGQRIGSPGGPQRNATQTTAPPAAATELARKAGLLATSTGGSR